MGVTTEKSGCLEILDMSFPHVAGPRREAGALVIPAKSGNQDSTPPANFDLSIPSDPSPLGLKLSRAGASLVRPQASRIPRPFFGPHRLKPGTFLRLSASVASIGPRAKDSEDAHQKLRLPFESPSKPRAVLLKRPCQASAKTHLATSLVLSFQPFRED